MSGGVRDWGRSEWMLVGSFVGGFPKKLRGPCKSGRSEYVFSAETRTMLRTDAAMPWVLSNGQMVTSITKQHHDAAGL
jgi:hypothetical protein